MKRTIGFILGCLLSAQTVYAQGRVVAVIVHDSATHLPIVNVQATLSDAPDPKTGVSDGNGYTPFFNVSTTLRASQLILVHDGYEVYSQHVDLMTDGDEDLPGVEMTALPGPPPSLQPLPLHIVGRDFYTPDNRLWQWRGITAFRLYQAYLSNQDIGPILNEYHQYGANVVRVLGMFNWPDRPFRPQEHPDYFTRLPAFAQTIGAHGLYLELTALADAQYLYPSTAAQQQYLDQVSAQLRGLPNVFIEMANESQINGVDTTRLSCPAGIISARSNAFEGQEYPQPPCIYNTFHGRRDDIANPYGKWVYDDVWWIYANVPNGNRPLIHDEPGGFDEVYQPGRRSNDPVAAFNLGAISAIFLQGATYHCTSCIEALPLPSIQAEAARQFFRGFNATARDVRQ